MVKWRNLALKAPHQLAPPPFVAWRKHHIRGKPLARRRPRPTIREENERALLEAAELIFAEQGFAGATTAAIARRAGVPKANLHYYFPTKEGLYRSVIERVLTAWLAAASSFDASDDPRGALSLYRGENGSRARDAARDPDLVGGDHARRADDPGFPRYDADRNGSCRANGWCAAGSPQAG